MATPLRRDWAHRSLTLDMLNHATTYYWQIVAKDAHGAQSVGPVWTFTTAPPPNTPPDIPHDPTPPQGAHEQLTTVTLSWVCSDPDGDAITYDIYFGTDDPPATVLYWGQTTASVTVTGLNFTTTYYWRVLARDARGAVTWSPVWSFTTRQEPNHPPVIGSDSVPSDGATGLSPNVSFEWYCYDPDPQDTVTYDFYFGTDNPPIAKLYVDLHSTATTVQNLSYSTTYYWRIVAKDSRNAWTYGPIWSFTTGAHPNSPPNPPSNPRPSDGATGQPTDVTLSWSCSDPDPGDTLTYDLYFGQDNPPMHPLYTNLTKNTASVTGLEPGKVYYWRIIASDNQGGTAPGPVWSFRTNTGTGSCLQIALTEHSGATLHDYQVLVHLDTQSLILTGKMRSDCGDIRFFDSDRATPLPYWIENGIAGERGCGRADTWIWVKVPRIEASATKTIFLTYGDPSLTSQSDIFATFLFADDFNDNIFDTNRWQKLITLEGQLNEQNQRLEHNSGQTQPNSRSEALSAVSFDGPVVLELRFKKGGYVYRMIEFRDEPRKNAAGMSWQDWGPINFYVVKEGEPGSGEEVIGGSWSAQYNPEYYLMVRHNPDGTWTIGLDVPYSQPGGPQSQVRTFSTVLPLTTALRVSLEENVWDGASSLLERWEDDVRVRKYVSPEPTVSVVGACP